jgi:pectate lyase
MAKLVRESMLPRLATASDGYIYMLTVLAGLLWTSSASVPNVRPPAFPGAQGGGAAAVGGRGGSVCEVTNLKDSGSNSFRDCLTRKGPRTVVFRVAGIIQLRSQIMIGNPYITIAGQTAPGGGILLAGTQMGTVNPAMIFVGTHDVVIRYIRIRIGVGPRHSGGPSAGIVGIAIENYAIYNVMIDHVSISWWDNKPFIIYSNYGPGVRNVTIQWSMTNEGLAPDASRPGSQSTCGGAGDSNGSFAGFTNNDYHHNFYSDCSHRLLETSGPSMRDVNNIRYNWSYFATQSQGSSAVDFIGNLYKAGPSTSGAYACNGHPCEILIDPFNADQTGNPSIYMLGNKGPNQANPQGDQWVMVNQEAGYQTGPTGPAPASWHRSAPLPAEQFPIVADDVNNLENVLLPTVGASQRLDCNGNWVSNRDAVDTRLIQEYKAGTGIIPSSETQVGGFPTIDPGTPCADSDHDGIPDAWEIAHGLNPKDPSDGPKLNRDGYTNLEHFLNGGSPARTHHFKGRSQRNGPPKSHVR